ncbi:Glycerol 2-dehydrogenase (NADP(+)) [Ophidiomyces ophidiicola]|nr:Glycerol 2-dehydrogenase (NADP(+)) [Ophidiomyces ophidiicola]KAI1981402.1 Glycerol 2-dehydrogenase (NADP(+)) [Ophidiomyces ophidiicola]KAI1989444.1 Glycerol 2-dehydrogenase (NADP(+)) [Ophidiomyces ophidiicola]KAI1989703.1 Glycerol 2-dehydrogenase (NADP(+)) [Ophidiomyces ophidiicola]
MSQAITFKLSNGVAIPALGFGTFSNEGVKGETYKAVLHALRAGYRHLDCAWFYMNEEEVGEGIKDFLKEKQSVKRSDLFITTKVWNHLHEFEEVEWSLNDSLKKLQLEYVDLFLVHWPIAAERDDDYMPKIGSDGKYVIKEELTKNPEPTWRGMEAVYNAGKAKAIGLSNFTIPGIKQVLSFAKIPPHANQIEIHPFLPNTELVNFCFSHGILPQAYSPLGSQNQVPSTGEKVATDPTLNAIAKQGGHTLAQVLIAWGLKRGYVVLPKSSNPARISSNFREIELTEQQFEAVNLVAEGRHCRFVNMKDTFGYNVWPEEE